MQKNNAAAVFHLVATENYEAEGTSVGSGFVASHLVLSSHANECDAMAAMALETRLVWVEKRERTIRGTWRCCTVASNRKRRSEAGL